LLCSALTWIAIWRSFSFRFSVLNDGDFTRGISNERWNLILAQRDPMEKRDRVDANASFFLAYLYGL